MFNKCFDEIEIGEKVVSRGRIAYGLLVLSVASGLVPLQPQYTTAFYGWTTCAASPRRASAILN